VSPETRNEIRQLPMLEVVKFWDVYEASGEKNGEHLEVVRDLIQNDLFYLMVRACQRKDMIHPWVYARVREVEKDPDGYLDLWSRGHYKSSILTFGLTISDILNDPEVTFGIFSHTRPIAKAFLRQIMREFESNKILQGTFPDILWGENLKDAPKWSEDDGLIVKRRTNPNEATIEAWGLVDGQPTSKHFRKLLYDDVVTQASVNTPEMIEKTKVALEQSYNLASDGAVKRFAGTRWDFNDTYATIIERGTVKLRFHPGREKGEEDGKSVYWSEQVHHEKRRDMGPHTYAAQVLLNPKAHALQGFEREWLRFYQMITPAQAKKMNKYILVDSANEKRQESDYTAMWVIGLGADGNYYCLDMVRDRLNLTERTNRLFALYDRWKPIKQVRWERYGLNADIQHIKTEQEHRNYRFDITEVAGITKKDDRIGRLIPLFEQGKIYLPKTLFVTNWEKITVDVVRSFIEEEYAGFPVSGHKDLLDALARICEPDLHLVWPKDEKVVIDPPRIFNRSNSNTAWMS